MPVPIMPVGIESMMKAKEQKGRMAGDVDYGKIDISDVAKIIQQRSQSIEGMTKISNMEANLLFKLWKDSNTGSPDDFVKIPSEFNNGDVLRLKASGLVSGDNQMIRFTPRGKEVIVNMVLADQNVFDKKASTKPYERIVAESKLKGGPRLSVGKKSS